MQFADALQKTIQRGVEAQAEENRNARLDKQSDKIKIFDGSNPAECHPGSKRCMPSVAKLGGHLKKCYSCVPDKRSEISF